MVRSKSLLILLCIGSVWLAPVAAPSDSLVSFLAGVEVLRATSGLTTDQKAARYRELEIVCGIKGKDAVQKLASYRDDPVAWKEINDRMQTIIDNDTTVTDVR